MRWRPAGSSSAASPPSTACTRRTRCSTPKSRGATAATPAPPWRPTCGCATAWCPTCIPGRAAPTPRASGRCAPSTTMSPGRWGPMRIALSSSSGICSSCPSSTRQTRSAPWLRSGRGCPKAPGSICPPGGATRHRPMTGGLWSSPDLWTASRSSPARGACSSAPRASTRPPGTIPVVCRSWSCLARTASSCWRRTTARPSPAPGPWCAPASH